MTTASSDMASLFFGKFVIVRVMALIQKIELSNSIPASPRRRCFSVCCWCRSRRLAAVFKSPIFDNRIRCLGQPSGILSAFIQFHGGKVFTTVCSGISQGPEQPGGHEHGDFVGQKPQMPGGFFNVKACGNTLQVQKLGFVRIHRKEGRKRNPRKSITTEAKTTKSYLVVGAGYGRSG